MHREYHMKDATRVEGQSSTSDWGGAYDSSVRFEVRKYAKMRRGEKRGLGHEEGTGLLELARNSTQRLTAWTSANTHIVLGNPHTRLSPI